MSAIVDDLKPILKVLPPSDRAELAQFLLRSLEREEEATDPAWRDELLRRVDEIKTGQVNGKPAAEVFARIREKYS